jgi:hypothetical protein
MSSSIGRTILLSAAVLSGAFLPAARAAHISELFRTDGSVNIVAVKVWAGAWRWNNLAGGYTPAADPNFINRLPSDIVLAVLQATAVNGVGDFEGYLFAYLGWRVSTAFFTVNLVPANGYWAIDRQRLDFTFGSMAGQDPLGELTGDLGLRMFLHTEPLPESAPPAEMVEQLSEIGELLASFGFGPAIDIGFGGAPGAAVAKGVWEKAHPLELVLQGGLNLAELGVPWIDLVLPGLPNGINGQRNSLRVSLNLTPANNGEWMWEGVGTLEFRLVPEPTSPGLLAALALAWGWRAFGRGRFGLAGWWVRKNPKA